MKLGLPGRALLGILGAVLAVAQQTAPPSTSSGSAPEPVATFKANSRRVTIDVVVKDRDGRPVRGLTADDFELFEQASGWRKEKRPQKVAAVHSIDIARVASGARPNLQLPYGVYTNQLTPQTNPVPPTIMLVDALNTPWASRVQVRIQMVRMLRTIPDDVPVVIFLLGRRLQLLQNFTTDRKLLKSALEKSSTLQAGDLQELDPRDDPDSLSAVLEDIPGAPIDTIQNFEQEAFAAAMDIRERVTLDALRSLARHVAGYPGRKNLLWISSSFPLALNPDFENAATGGGNLYGSGTRSYQQDIRDVANLLGDINMAIYPIDPAGLQVSSWSQAATCPRGNGRVRRLWE